MSKLELCEDIQISEEFLHAYVAVTGDRDGGFYSSDTACPGGYFWLPPSCRSSNSTCIPALHPPSDFIMVEMMQKAAFWNIPLAIAAVEGYSEDYFPIVQGYKAIFWWWFPDHRLLAESAAGDQNLFSFQRATLSTIQLEITQQVLGCGTRGLFYKELKCHAQVGVLLKCYLSAALHSSF